MFYDVGSCTNQNTWKISMMTTIIQTQPRSGKSLATSFSSRAIKWLKLEGRRCKAWNISASCPKKTSKKTLFDSLKEIIMTNYHYLLCSWRRFSTPTEIFSDSIFRGRCDHMNLRDTLRKIHSNRPASVSIADAKSTMRRKSSYDTSYFLSVQQKIMGTPSGRKPSHPPHVMEHRRNEVEGRRNKRYLKIRATKVSRILRTSSPSSKKLSWNASAILPKFSAEDFCFSSDD